MFSMTRLILLAASIHCIYGIQDGGYVVIKGKKEKSLNVTGSSISSPRSKIECADWCLRNPWCVAATYMKNGGPNGMICFPSSVRGGCLEDDVDSIVIKRKEVSTAGYKDCKELRDAGFVNDGWYRITPGVTGDIDVVCDMNTDGGGWTLFQQRRDGSTDFYRGWDEYANGFGDATPSGNFWIGLNHIYELTSIATTELYVKLTAADGHETYARYSNFGIDDSSNNFAIHVSDYSGDAGDALTTHEGKEFCTFDNDNPPAPCANSKCPLTFHGAWWYGCCYKSNLNGEYLSMTARDGENTGMIWDLYVASSSSLGTNSMMKTTMMIRRACSAGP